MRKAIFLCAIVALSGNLAFGRSSPPAHAPCVKEDHKIASPAPLVCMYVYKATDLYAVTEATVEPVQGTKQSEMYIAGIYAPQKASMVASGHAIRQRNNRPISLNSYTNDVMKRNYGQPPHLHIDPGLNSHC